MDLISIMKLLTKEECENCDWGGSESYVDAVGDGWHDNFAFEDTMRESRKIASRINKNVRG